MSARIAAPATTPIAQAKESTEASKAEAELEKTKEAGKGFEEIFVRQILASAKIAGKSGYADMAVEAIAGTVTKGGGIGLGRAIEDALAAHHRPPPPEAQATEARKSEKSVQAPSRKSVPQSAE